MEKQLKKIETALICSGLNRVLKRTIQQKEKFEERMKIDGYYERFTDHQKVQIIRNKSYKIKVLTNLIEEFEKSLQKDDLNRIMSERDFDYGILDCLENTNDKNNKN